MKVYLDNAATTPMEPRVIEEMSIHMASSFGNASSIHSFGREARLIIEKARKRIAQSLNAGAGEIFFTSGGTESNNMAIRCAVRDLGIKYIITSAIEHPCVKNTCERLAQSDGVEIRLLSVDSQGHLNLDELKKLLYELPAKECLVSLMHANNEIGTMCDLKGISEIVEEAGALMHSDTVQTVAHHKFDMTELKLHFLSGSGHKFHGPKGIGFIYVRNGININPLLTGGAQERNMRSGTENTPGIVGLAKAIELETEELEETETKVRALKSYMIEELKSSVPGVCFNGDVGPNSLFTVLNVGFPKNEKSEMLNMNLDIAGVACSGGSACSSGAEGQSHVLQAIGANPENKAIRFSFSKFTTKEEIDFALEQIRKVYPVLA